MTIQELERLLDMPRATIRYYEREGLIAPPRAENGYREYSIDDVQALERVRLLRALDCSVAEIREIKEGRAQLEEILREKSRMAEKAREEKANVRDICDDICRSVQRFDELDAKKYLSGAWREEVPAKPVQPPKEEVPKVNQWRRFWARMLDWQIYSGIWTALLSFLWPSSQLSENGLMTLLGILIGNLIMIALEPVLLHFFGTTPGKWVLGLRVVADGGGKLTLKQARERTTSVLWHGLRWHIPIWELRAMWQRYRDVDDGTPLYWEEESAVVQKRKGSVAGYIALRALIATALVCCMGLGRMPAHRGALTPEQFAENYNRLIWVYGSQAREIDAQGNWIDEPEDPGVVVIRLGDAGAEMPGLDMDVRDGTVQGVQMTMHVEAGEEGNMAFLPVDSMARAAIALVCAESPWYRAMLPFGSDEMAILRFCEQEIDPTGRGKVAADIDGMNLLVTFDRDTGELLYSERLEIGRWEIEYAANSVGGVYGTMSGGALILPEGEDGEFEMTFTVSRK